MSGSVSSRKKNRIMLARITAIYKFVCLSVDSGARTIDAKRRNANRVAANGGRPLSAVFYGKTVCSGKDTEDDRFLSFAGRTCGASLMRGVARLAKNNANYKGFRGMNASHHPDISPQIACATIVAAPNHSCARLSVTQ